MTSKLRTFIWFVIANSALAIIISLKFYEFFPAESFTALSFTYALISTLGHMFFMAFVMGLPLIAASYIPNRVIRRTVFALAGSGGLIFLFIDTVVFAQYRFHINMAVLTLVFSDDIVSFPLVTWAIVIGSLAGAFAAEYALISYIENRQRTIRPKLGRKIALGFLVLLVCANLINIWGSANAMQSVTIIKKYLPLYHPAAAGGLMVKLGLVDPHELETQKKLNINDEGGDLNYPLKPIEGAAPEKPFDIVLITVDSWRYDTLSKEVTPNIWEMSKNGVVFNNHLSTGNSTRAGIFGLFYGLPGTYWHSFLANQRSAAIIDRMQQLDYQLGIFASAQLTRPEFNRTIFRNVMNLRMKSEGDSAAAKDRDITDDWKQWYAKTDRSKPSFTFLFYDAPHAYDFPVGYDAGYKPVIEGDLNYLSIDNDTDPTPIFNTYKTSVHYVDSLVKEVADTLKASGRLDRTVIIVTGDHGQEMNDNKLNFWGHNGNFTDAQIKVPFVIIAPDAAAGVNKKYTSAYTSHEDVVPTLMKNYLGVTNNTADYSTGFDLYGDFVQRDWVISSKYSGYAVVSKDTIEVMNSMGGYEVFDRSYRPKDQKLDTGRMKGVFESISRYMK